MVIASLVNGVPGGQIAIDDRGFCYGDGLFETMAVIGGRIRFEQNHLRRLDWGCRRLGIPPPDEALLRGEISTLISRIERAVLKLIITRGAGGRGYRPGGDLQPTRVLSVHPWPDYPVSHYRKGITARICATRLGINPALAGVKHLNRLEQIMARREWDDASIAEGILLDTKGCVISGTMSNVFAARADELLTPALSGSGVRGVMREIVMRLSERQGIVTKECDLGLEQVLGADEVFVTNALIGIWPVVRLNETLFHRGPMCGALMDGLATLGVAECAAG